MTGQKVMASVDYCLSAILISISWMDVPTAQKKPKDRIWVWNRRPGYIQNSEGNHANDFQKFVTELRKINTPFIFMSGDRHLSEIMQFPRSLFGKPSFEITSSPIHSKTFDSEDKNPWRVVAEKSRVNFTMIDSVARDNHWFMDVENIGDKGDVYYRRELAVFIKDLQNNLQEVRKRRSGKRRYKKLRPRRNRRR